MMMVAAADCLCEVLDIGELAGLAGVGKVRGKLSKLIRRGGVAFRCRGLRCVSQIGGNLLRHLLVFGRVGLLELLQRAHQFGKGRELAIVGG